jgi:hypothetical protein
MMSLFCHFKRKLDHKSFNGCDAITRNAKKILACCKETYKEQNKLATKPIKN